MVASSLLATVCALTIQVLVFGQTKRTTTPGINAKPYRLLCDIYNVAANPLTSLYDASEVEKARDEIDLINVSLADGKWFGEIDAATEKEKLSDAFKAQNGDYENLFGRWKKAVSKVKEGTTDIKKLPTENPIVKMAQIKLNSIEDQVIKIVKKINKLNESAKLSKIKEDFETAIGEPGCATDNENCGIKGTRGANTCGKVDGTRGTGGGGSDTMSGTNLIVDFFCLCAKRTGSSDADGKECIDTTGTSASWNAGTLSKGKALWEALREGCKVGRSDRIATSADGEEALARFLAEVQPVKHAKDADSTGHYGNGMLGVCVHSSSTCNGNCDGDLSSGNTGVCVAYGNTHVAWGQIPWLMKMRDGISALKAAEDSAAIVRSDLVSLKILQLRAKEIYKETQVTLEFQPASMENPTVSQNQKSNPSSPADTTKAQEATTVNAAVFPHFVMPWTLLI